MELSQSIRVEVQLFINSTLLLLYRNPSSRRICIQDSNFNIIIIASLIRKMETNINQEERSVSRIEMTIIEGRIDSKKCVGVFSRNKTGLKFVSLKALLKVLCFLID